MRDYVVSGAPDLVAIEQELAALEQQMAGGAHDEATLSAAPHTAIIADVTDLLAALERT